MFTVLAIVAASAWACVAGDADARRTSESTLPASAASITITDDAGEVVQLARPAQRVISLIPSAMETLIALGATNQIVGRTRYDVAPEVAALPSVGGGIDASVEAIISLHPDLVISWESDKRQLIREKLTSLGIPVFILRTQDTTDVFRGIAAIGRMTGRDSAAKTIAGAVRDTLDVIRRAALGLATPRVFYVVFTDPPMTAGPGTFIGQLVALAGGRSIFAETRELWPTIAMEEIVRRDPDVIVVPVGEFRTNSLQRFRSLAGWRDLRAVRDGRVVTVPSDLLSRPSPSIAQAARVLFAALHPDSAAVARR